MTASSLRALARSTVNGEDPRTSDFVDGTHYPSCDGKPMTENVAQWRSVLHDGAVLMCRYEHDPDVMVAGNVAIYPKQGQPKVNVAPDLLVAFGVSKLPHRSSYKVWVEGKAPDFVMEVASPGTWEADRGRKKAAYAEMGVREYWLFDPTGEFFDPPLEGYCLKRDNYMPLAASGPGLALPSKALGLELRPDAGHVRFHDPATGEDLRTPLELKAESERQAAAHKREAAARRREAAARRKAEARVAELEAQVRQLRSQSAP